MNLKEIKEIIILMNENNLNEVEVERNGLKIKLKKSPDPGQEILIERTPTVATRHAATPEHAEAVSQEASEKKLIEIKAPIVGTFYKSPSPEAEAFVQIGQEIEVGQVVCIIEAMKLMNEIKSEVRGKVVDMLAENADPVEYGQILFLIEPL